MTRIGYQIPFFGYPGVGPAELFEAVAAQAAAADRSGFDTVMVMDHFYQLPMIGNPDDYMLECYTLLSALSQRTSNVRLSALVTGNTYRNPALLAKIITTLDVVSGGRAQLGIGAGWFELEHDALGFRVRHVHRSVRQARGGPADHRGDVGRRASQPRRGPLHGA